MENIRNEILWRVYFVMGLAFITAAIIFFRAAQIQISEGELWKSKSESLYVRYRPVAGERGNILSADGSLLATSVSVFELRMDCNSDAMTDEVFNSNIDSLAFCLASYVDNSYTIGGHKERLELARKNKERYLLIKKNVTFPELQMIQRFPLFREGRYKGGLIVIRESKREHPFKMLAHRTIGYIRDNAAPVGLESSFNGQLAGEEGKQLMQRLPGGDWLPINDISEIAPREGKDIVTTLDVNLQDIVETALEKAIRTHDADHGTAILMEVKTGAIKAIANIGKTEKGDLWETYNFGIGESMESGSTFKLATTIALLESGGVDLTDTVNLSNGKRNFYNEEMIDASPHGLYKTTFQKAFEISSNVGIATLADAVFNQDTTGCQRFLDYMTQLRLKERTGIELDGEGFPYIKNLNDRTWSKTTIPWMAIGYESRLTPLQTLTLYNTVANNGQMMKPYLVTETQSYGETVESFDPIVLERNIASAATITKVKQLLEGVVERGTAKEIKSKHYRIAGKTGTAIIGFNKYKREIKKYMASFAGYFPADNPQYSCIVVVNNPKNGSFYGGSVAAPVFREIADKCFATKVANYPAINLSNKPPYHLATFPKGIVGHKEDLKIIFDYAKVPYVKDNHTNSWAVLRVKADTAKQNKRDSLFLDPRALKQNLVPSVIGMGLRDAIFTLENSRLKVRFTGIGTVKTQSVMPGTRIAGQVVYLNLE